MTKAQRGVVQGLIAVALSATVVGIVLLSVYVNM